jgi:hypothetical protein
MWLRLHASNAVTLKKSSGVAMQLTSEDIISERILRALFDDSFLVLDDLQ